MRPPTPPPCDESGLPDPERLTEERIAQIAKALGHPERIRILEQFDECCPHIVQDVVDHSALAQSTISEHLRILREADILFTRRDGPRSWYCMRRSVLRQFAEAVTTLASRTERLGV